MKLFNKSYEEIDYDEIEIYSYNRGELLKKHLDDLELEKNRLLEEMEVEEDFDKELELNKRVKYIEKYKPLLDELLDEERELHPTAKLIIKLKIEDLILKELDAIFQSEITSPLMSRCIEELRDGIIFRKEGEIKEVFSICFSCAMIKSRSEGIIYGDRKFYESYQKIFK